MAFVFVHGVKTRDGEAYRERGQLRDSFLREVVAPEVGIWPDTAIRSPYLGDVATQFWNNLSVIPGDGELEKFGPGDEVLPPSVGAAVVEQNLKQGEHCRRWSRLTRRPRST